MISAKIIIEGGRVSIVAGESSAATAKEEAIAKVLNDEIQRIAVSELALEFYRE